MPAHKKTNHDTCWCQQVVANKTHVNEADLADSMNNAYSRGVRDGAEEAYIDGVVDGRMQAAPSIFYYVVVAFTALVTGYLLHG